MYEILLVDGKKVGFQLNRCGICDENFIIIIIIIINSTNFTNQDSLFWFDMNSVLDKPPSAPAVMDGIFGTSQIMVLDSLKNMRKLSNEGFRLRFMDLFKANR